MGILIVSMGFPGGAVIKNMASNAGDLGDVSSIPGSRRFPGVGKWQSTPVFLPGKSHEWRNLVGYIPCGHKDSKTTEQMSTHRCTNSVYLLGLLFYCKQST